MLTKTRYQVFVKYFFITFIEREAGTDANNCRTDARETVLGRLVVEINTGQFYQHNLAKIIT